VEETSGTAQEKTGTKKVIAFKNAIIAAGSQAVRLPFMPNDPRVVDSTGALELNWVHDPYARATSTRHLRQRPRAIGPKAGVAHGAPRQTTNQYF
jgi:hypothetical protein